MKEKDLNPICDPSQAYDFAVYRRYYELGQTMSRNNFFMVFQGVVVVGALNLISSDAADWWVCLIISLLGLVLSILQFQMACSGCRQILQTSEMATAREIDLLSQLPETATTYHFFTRAGPDPKRCQTRNSTASYDEVKPWWKGAGFEKDPNESNPSYGDECNLLAQTIRKSSSPSRIAIWVAVALWFFWLALLVRLLVLVIYGG